MWTRQNFIMYFLIVCLPLVFHTMLVDVTEGRHKSHLKPQGAMEESVDEESLEELVDSTYGKNQITFLHVQRDGPKHYITELEVSTRMTLTSHCEYIHGSNKNIPATDTQKNMVYILAKNHGVEGVEEFGILVARAILNQYPRCVSVTVGVKKSPWARVVNGTVEHDHGFILTPTATRFTSVTIKREGEPQIESGIEELQLLKTTSSGFEGFIKDEYTTLKYTKDRILSTKVFAKWTYGRIDHVNFTDIWNTVLEIIKDTFFGPAPKGEYSPSVQHTLYKTCKQVLKKIKSIDKITMMLPNLHYIPVDFERFSGGVVNMTTVNNVVMAIDKPTGMIEATVARKAMNTSRH